MKVAEALALRADLQKRLDQLSTMRYAIGNLLKKSPCALPHPSLI
jgi:hypothetical protein